MSDLLALPLKYRPRDFDDWGFIRDANDRLVAVVRFDPRLTEEDLEAHRSSKTDPARAVGELIVRAVNAHGVMNTASPRFAETFCSQCGGAFGPGDHGYSHCDNHRNLRQHPPSGTASNTRDNIS